MTVKRTNEAVYGARVATILLDSHSQPSTLNPESYTCSCSHRCVWMWRAFMCHGRGTCTRLCTGRHKFSNVIRSVTETLREMLFMRALIL
jgi:hypothetical protein